MVSHKKDTFNPPHPNLKEHGKRLRQERKSTVKCCLLEMTLLCTQGLTTAVATYTRPPKDWAHE